MRWKRTVRIAVDALMTVLLLFMFAVPWTGVLRHERLGIVLFILLLLHNALNFRWYKSLFTGPYNARRLTWATVNVLLLASFAMTAVSGVMISQHVFGFLDLNGSLLWRKIHLCASYWGLILTGAHIGLHLPPVRQVKRVFLRRAWVSVLFAGGLYACFALSLWKKLFFLETFSAHAPSAAAGILLHLAAAGFFTLATQFLFFKSRQNNASLAGKHPRNN